MSEQIKLSQEELDSIKQLQNEQQSLVNQFGQLEYQMQLLELQKDQLVETIGKLQNEEKEIGTNLTEKYGNGTVDLESGMFTKTE
tara:strand:+ start:409 stop:663 length:255 start_codon:yes stop_codon:yes gene_type:complete